MIDMRILVIGLRTLAIAAGCLLIAGDAAASYRVVMKDGTERPSKTLPSLVGAEFCWLDPDDGATCVPIGEVDTRATTTASAKVARGATGLVGTKKAAEGPGAKKARPRAVAPPAPAFPTDLKARSNPYNVAFQQLQRERVLLGEQLALARAELARLEDDLSRRSNTESAAIILVAGDLSTQIRNQLAELRAIDRNITALWIRAADVGARIYQPIP